MCIPQNLFLLHLFTISHISSLPSLSPYFSQESQFPKAGLGNFVRILLYFEIFMVNSSGEIQSILSFFFLSFSLSFLSSPSCPYEVVQWGMQYQKQIFKREQGKNARSYIFHVMTCSVFMRRTIQSERKKKGSKQQINLHMSIYKTHDLLSKSRIQFVVQKLKIRL